MATRPKAVIESRNGEKFSPITIAKNVLTDDGQNLHDILSDRKEDMMTPTIENSSSMFKVGQGDNVDYSSNVVSSAYEDMVLKGKTMVNCIQESSSQDIVLPYEFADGQYVTINDTKESGTLGVELKGQTLVNIHGKKTPTLAAAQNDWYSNLVIETNSISFTVAKLPENWRYISFKSLNLSMLKPNTKYLVAFEEASGVSTVTFKNGDSTQPLSDTVQIVNNKAIVTTTSNWVNSAQILYIYVPANKVGTEVKVKNPMIIEYVEDMENWDIPYFEGMASCKRPVLHTAGSLFDAQKIIPNNAFTYSHSTNIGRFEFTNRGDVVANTSIQLPAGTYDISFLIRGVCDNGRAAITFAKDGEAWYGCSRTEIYYHQFGSTTFKEVKTKHTFDAPVTVTIVGHAWAGGATGSGWCEFKDIRFTPVGKSSILSLPEEVVLRSLPNGVHDTFNTRTGVYTQRIGEAIVNGSENWQLNNTEGTTTQRFFCSMLVNSAVDNNTKGTQQYLCDKLRTITWSQTCELGLTINGSGVFVYNNSIEYTVGSVKQWLSQNPVKLQYELATPIVTKINLSSTLKSWNTTTHIYSEIPENTLYPILSHSNPSYPVILKPSTKYSIVANSYSNSHTNSTINFNLGGATASTTVSNRVTTITTPSTLSNELLTMSGRGNKLNNVMVIDGDVIGDEPYFEGICDCKSPILSNVGKNLFDWEAHHWRLNRFQWSHGDGGLGNGNALGRAGVEWVSIKALKLKPNQTYYTNGYISFYENDGQGLCIGRRVHNGVFTVPTNAEIACVSTLINDGVKLEYMSDPKIIISEIEMEYEPYKSNILSCNGDKIELTEDMFEQGGVYFTKGQSFANATNNTAPDRIRLKTLLNLKPNTTYRVAIDNAYKVGVQLYNNEKLAVSDTGWVSDTTFTTKGGESAVALVIRKLSSAASISMSDFKNIKLQLSEVDKTIVLRSLPNGVCDTLNVETGEYVQRIGEITLNDSETNWSVTNQAGWESTPNTIAFGQYFTPRAKAYNAGEISSVICDKFATITANGTWAADKEGVSINQNSRFDIRIERTKLPDESLTGFKQWLLQNPITVQYELETPIVSTIDIQGFPYAYTNGHVQLSSGSIEQSLTPKVEYSVVTNRNGQIRSNQKMVERHQKQLDRLQAMILTNLVNTQYEQALTNLKYDLKNVREEVK